MAPKSFIETSQQLLGGGLAIPGAILMLLAMIMLPIPPFLLDLCFTFNITFSMIILLATVYCQRPLDFAVFPTILLVATLFRLALNIASTRVVLLHGHTGTAAAGKVIEAFGDVVIGGNYAVGLVVFAILVIINFVVVTKGAGRISEVSARFTLDAMPGKQMAIDADLNAGVITQEESKSRRKEVAREADFYGSMDGASKFVRGDAVAGILILFINMIGGILIGTLQHGMNFDEATYNYILLMIGDGLVAQIPSLLLSVGAALMVTRASESGDDVGKQVAGQIFNNPKILLISAGVIGVLGLIPGMPHIAFLGFSGICGYFAYQSTLKQDIAGEKKQPSSAVRPDANKATISSPKENAPAKDSPPKEISWDDVKQVDILGLEIGYRLISLVDNKQGGQLMERIKVTRRKLSQELGFLIPAIHIVDNLDLQPNQYSISLLGVPVAQATIHVDRVMAINPGHVFGKLEGVPGKDPAFGLDAIWIKSNQKDQAESLGYTVVDPSSVIATHLNQIMEENASELLGHAEVQKLLDRLNETNPKLVEHLVPDVLPLSTVVQVLQNLLQEKIPIRDMRTIVETLAEHGGKSQDPIALTAMVRIALRRLIIQKINGINTELPVITLNPDLEQLLLNSIQHLGEDGMGFEPTLADKIQRTLVDIVKKQETASQPSILLVPSQLRYLLSRFTRYSVPSLHVLSYQEVPDNKQLRIVGTIGK